MKPQKTRTPQEARAYLNSLGISMAAWARKFGFKRNMVCAVLRGELQCRIGQSHNIAVSLGMKEGSFKGDNGKEYTNANAYIPGGEKRTACGVVMKNQPKGPQP